MIAAIVIPIIFFYFLFITMRERKRKIEEWQKIGEVKEDSIISGRVIQSSSQSKRFVANFFIAETTLLLKNEFGIHKVVQRTPITPDFKEIQFANDIMITCYGYWDDKSFIFKRYQFIEGEKITRS
jgi:hypothetical protein